MSSVQMPPKRKKNRKTEKKETLFKLNQKYFLYYLLAVGNVAGSQGNEGTV